MSINTIQSFGRLTVDINYYSGINGEDTDCIVADFFVDNGVDIQHGTVTIAELRAAKKYFASIVSSIEDGNVVATISSLHGEKAAKSFGLTVVEVDGEKVAAAFIIDGTIIAPKAPAAERLAKRYS